MSKREPPIYTWKPKMKDLLCARDGKLFKCFFENLHPEYKDKMSVYDIFVIGKDSYISQLDSIANLINYFEAYHDTDHELMEAYLSIKYALDKEHTYNEDSMNSYIEFLYDILMTETIVEKIINCVEENYLDNIEISEDNKRKYIKSEKKHLESLEFTNQHIKILFCISIAMQLMVPPMFHYIQTNNIKLTKESLIIYTFYSGLFKIFNQSDTYELYDKTTNELMEYDIKKDDLLQRLADNPAIFEEKVGRTVYYSYYDKETCHDMYYTLGKVNMYNKLYVYVKSKVLESNAVNAKMFAQREILGKDLYWVINYFTKKTLITESIFKYQFPSKWDEAKHKYKENIVGLNKTIIKMQLMYFLREQFSKNLNEVTNQKNSEGLTGQDKLLMNSSKVDEGIILLADINVETTIARLKKDNDINISEEEIDYYVANYKPSDIQRLLINNYYAKYFSRETDLALIPRRQYMYLVLLLKKRLLLESGYEIDDEGKVHCAALPYILTGNISEKINSRLIRNNKFIAKLEENEIYQDLINEEYSYLHEIKPEYILQIISSIVNTRFDYVTYEDPSLTGTEIRFSEEKVTDEVLFFLYRCC